MYGSLLLHTTQSYPVILMLLQYFLLLRCARHMSVMGDVISALRMMIRVRKLVCVYVPPIPYVFSVRSRA